MTKYRLRWIPPSGQNSDSDGHAWPAAKQLQVPRLLRVGRDWKSVLELMKQMVATAN